MIEPPVPERPARRAWPVAAALFLTALAARLVFIAETHDAPGFRALAPGLDLDLYWRAADHLLEGRALSFELSSLSAPGFAYALAGWKAVVGGELSWFRCGAAVLGAVRVVLVLRLCARCGVPRWAGAAVGLSLALLPSLLYFDTMPSKVGVELTLLVLALLAVTAPLPAHRGRAALRGAIAGGLLGLLYLCQLGTLLVAVPIAAYVVLGRGAPGPRACAAAAIAVVVAATAAAFACRPRASGASGPPDRFLPRAGVDLAIGFHAGATGTYHPLSDVMPTPFGHAFGARIAVEAERGRAVSQAEADAAFRDRALAHVRAYPGAALAVAARRAWWFLRNDEVPDEHALESVRASSVAARLGPGFGWLVVLGAVGAVALWRRRARRTLLLLGGVLAVQVAACAITHVTWRYRVPATVPLAVLAGLGAAELGAALHRLATAGRAAWAGVAAWVAIPAAIAAAVTFWPGAPRADWLEGARARARFARAAEADAARLRALERAGPRDLEQAMLLHALGRTTEAFLALDARAPELHRRPDAAAAYLGYLAALGDYPRAGVFLGELDRHGAGLRGRVLRALPGTVAAALVRVPGARGPGAAPP